MEKFTVDCYNILTIGNYVYVVKGNLLSASKDLWSSTLPYSYSTLSYTNCVENKLWEEELENSYGLSGGEGRAFPPLTKLLNRPHLRANSTITMNLSLQ